MRTPVLSWPRFLAVASCVWSFTATGFSAAEPFRDPALPLEERITDLIARLTLPEKAGLMVNANPGIPRLGIPAYNWWNEGGHGVAGTGLATVFPHSIGLAAIWDEAMLQRVGEVVGVEGRAKYVQAAREGKHDRYNGLTFWSPCINLVRDPRWGRAKETYGEDPFLTARLGVAYVRGAQGDDPRHLRVSALAKHFAVHSGPEPQRHVFNAEPDAIDFHDSYLPAFEALVREAQVTGIMPAYTSLFGRPCVVNPALYDLLYRQWGFQGYVVSDCNAVRDLYKTYKIAGNSTEAEALAVEAGSCLTCGGEPPALADAVTDGLIDEPTLDLRLRRLLRVQFRLGLFDPPESVPYNHVDPAVVDSPAHQALALETARRSIVLLKNNGILPLRRDQLRRVALIGPNADSVPALVGKHAGKPSAPVTFAAGLRAALGPSVQVASVQGCRYVDAANGARPAEPDPLTVEPTGDNSFEAALAAARAADVVIFIGGTTGEFESEQMRSTYDGFDYGDRTRIELPPPQEHLLEALQACGRPIVVVLCSGSALAVPWAEENAAAVLEAWFPGQAGGTALADVLLGNVNPAGRLPVTFYRSTADLPAFTDYNLRDRTYRFFSGQPLYPFGHGLSYTRFAYAKFEMPSTAAFADPAKPLIVTVEVTNTGDREGERSRAALRHGTGGRAAPQPTLIVRVPNGPSRFQGNQAGSPHGNRVQPATLGSAAKRLPYSPRRIGSRRRRFIGRPARDGGARIVAPAWAVADVVNSLHVFCSIQVTSKATQGTDMASGWPLRAKRFLMRSMTAGEGSSASNLSFNSLADARSPLPTKTSMSEAVCLLKSLGIVLVDNVTSGLRLLNDSSIKIALLELTASE
ncbi:MAG: glycoside hydrolase family 3 C-terminal domain-containing protein [Pirellulales bacterium]